MFVGMFALGMPARMLWEALGWTVLTEEMVPRTLLMATWMSVGMAIWMRIRGCSRPAILEMCLAMFVPFVVMYPFYFLGLVNTTAVMVVGHVFMVPAMVVAMLLRKEEYTGGHRARGPETRSETRELAAQPEG
jgi:flagellar biosynthetic protein FliP